MTMPISTSATTSPVAALPWELAGAETRLGPAERPGRAIRGGPRRLRRLAATQPDLPYQRFGVTPLSPLIGAEISGVDLAPQPGQPALTRRDYPPVPAGLDGIGAVARRAGLDILVLDQTRPDIAMPVVKVVVPGLRHFWPRFGPGRLFDVPVRLGRLSRPTRYADLNPIPLYV